LGDFFLLELPLWVSQNVLFLWIMKFWVLMIELCALLAEN